MDLCEASRIVKRKIIPWLPKGNHEWRVALETLIEPVDAAHAELTEEVKAELRGLLAELEKAS